MAVMPEPPGITVQVGVADAWGVLQAVALAEGTELGDAVVVRVGVELHCTGGEVTTGVGEELPRLRARLIILAAWALVAVP